MPAPKPKSYTQQAPTNIGLGIARSAGQGLLFGFGDEVEAFTRSIVEDVDYEESLQQIRSELETFREESPIAAYGTEIATSIPSVLAGGAGLARLGVTGVGKIGALESAVYGAGVGEDAESRAKGAIIGAVTGGAASKAADKLLPKKSETAKKLQAKGIPLTPGQSLRDSGTIGSDLISALEDLSTSYPGAGAPIQAKRLETLIETNKVILDEAVKPLGIKIPKNLSNKEVYAHVEDVVDKKYENVLNKLSLSDTSNLETKLLDLVEESVLDPTEQARVLRIIDKNLTDKIKDGTLKGRDLKNAQTVLRQKAESFEKKGGFEGEVGQVLRQTKKILEDEINLQNTNSVELKKVNEVYRNMIPINDAMQQAVIQEGVFTPAQLLRAIRKADRTKRKKQVLKGEAPLQETATQAQRVLGSSYPESGTASRLLAQDVILNPTRLAKLVGPAAASEILMSRPFGVSPITGLLTAQAPTIKGTAPALSALAYKQYMESQQE